MSPGQPWYPGSPLRRLRLASGTILFVYVTTHLIDHALCNASYRVADIMLLGQKWVWQGIIGTTLLYSALVIHMGLGLFALYDRRNFLWSKAEFLQIILGLAFPALLANHLSVTRTAWLLYGLNKDYIAELNSLWISAPRTGWLQIAVLIAAWSHACLGYGFLLRLRRSAPRIRPILLAVAILLPALALLGYVQGGREVARALAAEPHFRIVHLGPEVVGTKPQVAHLAWLRDHFLMLYGALIVLVLMARGVRRVAELRAGIIEIRYPDGRRARVAPGLSVLDASRLHRIPHASVCGGRARCSTCRIRIARSDDPLPPPAPHELAVLTGIGADPAHIRLACQLRPTASLTVLPLIPPAVALDFVIGRAPRTPGEERFVAALFVDLRGSTRLAERRTPFDSVFLLGRFIDAVSRAIVASGGRPVQFLGDGVLALFGLETPPAEACSEALRALDVLAAELSSVADLFRQEAGVELRYGAGLHCGRTIVGEIGFADQVAFTALGETVNIAHRLQEMARDFEATAIVSDAVFATAGMPAHAWAGTEIPIRGREGRLEVRIIREPALAGREDQGAQAAAP